MSLWKRGNKYWADFTVEGVRYRKPTGTATLNAAKQRERELIQAATRGEISKKRASERLYAASEAYLAYKRIRWSARTLELSRERLKIVQRHFGDVRLTSITANSIAQFQHARHAAGAANRTVNMDVGVLSRVLKFAGRWAALKDHVELLPEGERTIGRALTREEQRRLIQVASSKPEWDHLYCAAVVAANTSMRRVEVVHLRRRDVDLFKKTVTIRRSKKESSHREIPLTSDAVKAIGKMIDRLDTLGPACEADFLWCACRWGILDPTKPTRGWDTAWRRLRNKAGLPGLRFHDLRHTFITQLAETSTSDFVMESLVGHLSRRMLDHYSHIRMDAKRKAIEAFEKHSSAEETWEEPKSGLAKTIQ